MKMKIIIYEAVEGYLEAREEDITLDRNSRVLEIAVVKG